MVSSPFRPTVDKATSNNLNECLQYRKRRKATTRLQECRQSKLLVGETLHLQRHEKISLTFSLASSLIAQITISITILATTIYFILLHNKRHQTNATTNPISVNYHFTRKCNKSCKFCFHTEKTSHIASETEMKHMEKDPLLRE